MMALLRMYPFPTSLPVASGTGTAGRASGSEGVVLGGAATASMPLQQLRHSMRAMLQDAVLVRAGRLHGRPLRGSCR
jgi:hypothetical protein